MSAMVLSGEADIQGGICPTPLPRMKPWINTFTGIVTLFVNADYRAANQ